MSFEENVCFGCGKEFEEVFGNIILVDDAGADVMTLEYCCEDCFEQGLKKYGVSEDEK